MKIEAIRIIIRVNLLTKSVNINYDTPYGLILHRLTNYLRVPS